MSMEHLFDFSNQTPIIPNSSWGGIFSNWNGKTITPDNAMRLTTVFTCNRVIAETLSSIALTLFEIIDEGKTKATHHPLYNILRLQPNPNITSVMWREMIVQDLNLRGNHYSQIIRNRKNEIIGLYPLRATAMKIVTSPSMEIIYRYTTGSKTYNCLPKEILHIRGLPSEDGILGISPIEYNRRAIQMGDTAQEYGINFFENGANPSGAFTKDGPLSQTAFDRLKADLRDEYVGVKNSSRPMLLEEGLTFTPISISNNESQFLELRKYQKEDIASIFRVPMHMINSLENATFSNIEHQSLEFVQFTMLPWIKRIEQQLTISLLSRDKQQKYSIKFNVDSLLRGDFKTRTDGYKNMHMIGAMTINDILKLENRNTIGTDGDKRYIQMNMSTIQNLEKGGN